LVSSIHSVLNQSYPPIEILICDDGSDDNSRELVEEIDDSRIKWFDGFRSGCPAVPRNRGLKESKGDWIAFLDSDDCWHNNKLLSQVDMIKRKGYSALCSNANRIINKRVQGPCLDLKDDSAFSFEDLVKCNSIICSSVLIKKSIIEKAGGFPEETKLKAFEDHALWLKSATEVKFMYSSSILLDYSDDSSDSVRVNNKGLYLNPAYVYFLRWSRWAHSLKQHRKEVCKHILKKSNLPLSFKLYVFSLYLLG
jgi:glycosyltransferase involved in cell wall biosynthesis